MNTLYDTLLIIVRDRLSNKIGNDSMDRKLAYLKKHHNTMEVVRTLNDVLNDNFKGVTLGKLFGL